MGGMENFADEPFKAFCPHGEVKSVHGRRTEVSCSCCGTWLGPPPAASMCSTCRAGVIEFPEGEPMSVLTIEKDGKVIAREPNIVIDSSKASVTTSAPEGWENTPAINIEIRAEPREHKFVERDDDLALCGVCGGGEGSLPTECPGERLAPEVEDAVYAGWLDHKAGQWMAPVCSMCKKVRPPGPRVSVTRLAAPAAAMLVLPSPMLGLVEILREKLNAICTCAEGATDAPKK